MPASHPHLRLSPLQFKYLLLCGSVVIYVNDGMAHKEFYEYGLLPRTLLPSGAALSRCRIDRRRLFPRRYGLLPGVHYVTVPDAKAVPAMVRAG